MAGKYRAKSSSVLLFTTSTNMPKRYARDLLECRLHGPKCDRRGQYCEEALKHPQKWGYNR